MSAKGGVQLDTLLGEHADPWSVGAAPEAYRSSLERLRQGLAAGSPVDDDIAELCGAAAMHPDPWVRFTLLRHLASVSPDKPEVQEVITWLTHDPEDFIVFEAVRQVGRLGLHDALPHLFMIVGRASERAVSTPGKPVGLGHSIVLDAIYRVVGSRDAATLQGIEDELFSGTKELPDLSRLVASDVPASDGGGHDHRGMMHVPPGVVSVEIPRALARGPLLFDWSDVAQGRRVSVAGFWMDRHQVTAAEYDRFAESEAARRHLCCHRQEPPDKLHVRNTIFDSRFRPDHPATGVDWFDAYAYAAAAGKRLPTEWEWQRAAQGDTARAYPWGDRFDAVPVRWLGSVLGREFRLVEDWRQALLEVSVDQRVPLTVPVGVPGNVSPLGIVGLSGNAWEWTLSNFVSGTFVEPEVGGRDLIDLAYDWRSYVVIRGGAWSSMPELTSAAFRGKDLLTDRHYEIGFRCVCDCGPEAGA
jgi:gamma-glutamyl hercynylcysteine S-oxide synthase